MKISINEANENWIVDRIRREWYNSSPDTVCVDNRKADVIWLLAPWMWKQVPYELLYEKPVVTTIHHIEPTKFNDDDFSLRDIVTNAYIVPNKYTKTFVEQHTVKPIHIIPYWLNTDIWKELKRRDMGFNGLSYVIGSFQRDTEGKDGISPKLCKGPDLFIETVEKISQEKNVFVLLSGYRRQYVINELEKRNIAYRYFEMVNDEQLMYLYNVLDLYIVSSRIEGGPQAIIECAATKTPIISRDVGMASVVLSKNCIVDVPNEIYYPTKEDVEENYRNVQNIDIRTLKNEYLKVFEEVI